MIAHLNGVVSAVGPDLAVLEVGGVGLAVSCTPSTLATLRIGTATRLATSLVVREDSLTLYGFIDDDERTLFELLQTASGVGPRLAQAVLAIHRPAAIRRAVASSDVAALTQVPGIGKKGAERLLIDLKDRLGAGPDSGPSGPADGVGFPGGEPSWRRSLMQALLGLGWNPREAEAALQAVTPEAEERIERGDSVEVGALLRQALSSLDRL
ncbi:MAG: Holliday junction branch migration protein RuvA [Geodermatophilaceae bacterium]|nr:Holliday junction branch migration protein RuvA [Geodermatophilaceae bacterium]